MSWPQIKKVVLLECRLLLFYATTTNHFSIRLWHATKSGFYMTTSDIQLRGCTERKHQSTSQSQTCTQKKVMVTVLWSATSLIHYSFLNSRETIISEKYAQQIDEIHQNLQCLQLTLVNRKGPVLHNSSQTTHHITNDSKVKWIGLWSFCFVFFNWRIIALQNCVVFCQTLTWISHRYAYVPSLLNLPPISLPIPPL